MDFTYTPEQDKFRAEIREWLERNSAEAFGRNGEGLGGSTASLLDVRDDERWNQSSITIDGSTKPVTSRSTGRWNGAAAART